MPARIVLVLLAAVLSAVAASASAADGDPTIGKKNFRQCGACHELAAGKTKVGPSLHGIIGRKAAGADGFSYSPSLREAAEKGLVWDEVNLMAYLENPVAFLKSYLGKDKITNKMFNRYAKEDFRRDVIAYLKDAAK